MFYFARFDFARIIFSSVLPACREFHPPPYRLLNTLKPGAITKVENATKNAFARVSSTDAHA